MPSLGGDKVVFSRGSATAPTHACTPTPRTGDLAACPPASTSAAPPPTWSPAPAASSTLGLGGGYSYVAPQAVAAVAANGTAGPAGAVAAGGLGGGGGVTRAPLDDFFSSMSLGATTPPQLGGSATAGFSSGSGVGSAAGFSGNGMMGSAAFQPAFPPSASQQQQQYLAQQQYQAQLLHQQRSAAVVGGMDPFLGLSSRQHGVAGGAGGYGAPMPPPSGGYGAMPSPTSPFAGQGQGFGGMMPGQAGLGGMPAMGAAGQQSGWGGTPASTTYLHPSQAYPPQQLAGAGGLGGSGLAPTGAGLPGYGSSSMGPGVGTGGGGYGPAPGAAPYRLPGSSGSSGAQGGYGSGGAAAAGMGAGAGGACPAQRGSSGGKLDTFDFVKNEFKS